MSLLVRPNQVELSFTVHCTSGCSDHTSGGASGYTFERDGRVLVKMDVYGDIVLIRKLCYQTLMVLHFSV